MRKYSIILTLIIISLSAYSQDKPENPILSTIEYNDIGALTNEQLDTINVRKKLSINDYTMAGFQYGIGLSSVMWNPGQKQNTVITPVNIGATITKYGKMFGYMPYFGLQTGIFYAKEGYQFKYNDKSDYIYKVEGAERAILDVIEVPILFHFHMDMWNFKIMAQLGCYGGYRLSIHRFPGKTGNVRPEIEHSFLETDRRMDYGLKGGVGFGIVFDPYEIHFQAMYKHSLSSLYDPDYAHRDYYRYAYPTNIIISVGLHYHLTKRTGRTKAEIRKMAYDMVYEIEEDVETED